MKKKNEVNISGEMKFCLLHRSGLEFWYLFGEFVYHNK